MKEKLREPSLRLHGSHYETLLTRHPNVLGEKHRFVLCKRYGLNGLGPATKREIADELGLLTSEAVHHFFRQSIAMLEKAETEVSSRLESGR